MSISIQIQNVTKCFRENVVIDHANLNMIGGNIYGLIGRNGSGKTVLMKCLCGFMPVDHGTITINDVEITAKRIIPDCIGAIIESPGFLPFLSGYQNLKSLAAIRGIVSDNHLRLLMQEIGLAPESKKHVSKYSLGMKQKLGIIQAIMEDPPILIFDEPMNGLDADSVSKVRNILLQKKKEGKLIILATHIREDVDHLCDHVFHIQDGKIVSIGSAKKF